MPARTDRTTDPDLLAALLLARRGQAYFSRKLNELGNDELDVPSLVPGWTRRHVVAHVGLNARALTRLTEWAATGVETPMYASREERDAEIEYGATLPARALRSLSAHAAVHLDVEWRDLPPAAWAAPVRTALGRTVPASETVWMRTREVWVHAVDLDNGASFRQLPPELVDALLADVARMWGARPGDEPVPVLEPTDRPRPAAQSAAGAVAGAGAEAPVGDGVRVRGRAADLARWATGRGGAALLTTADGSPVPSPPRWL
ncbi:maleylpyruvate isomerase family mycothiol-dependent enzyme [Cellulomonas wangsupingiae]|uniref:Maleylpyruvate isomerase family mycothiol-dependent enzyme n=1 Tax=Cellulomonas wangsupingiae TaxID=2968085 RepID=A0ABY5K6V2_9CELL|nr:maleylpyruvate isomerase family mycothiol-dependent enzyme [Cellulomonas wangsupingiae]MCC2335009.1 maleylpyruvate isomerase family mycothiol-dependent enzyme [Cellulomonas wangsupingiae]UUI65508.1 maleylpyruvate isomerase family mycothiol-dependent enzyme [Cellulomonas wangsupingiae]